MVEFQRETRVFGCLVAAAVFLATDAAAQEAPANAESVETVVVTGSRTAPVRPWSTC